MSWHFLAVFAGIPYALFLALVLLPRGRVFRIGFALTALGVIAAWWHFEMADDPWGQVLAVFSAIMALLAVLAQTLRLFVPRWAYIAVVALILAVVSGAILYMVGG